MPLIPFSFPTTMRTHLHLYSILAFLALAVAPLSRASAEPPAAANAGPGGMMLNPSRFITELPSSLYEPLRLKRQFGW